MAKDIPNWAMKFLKLTCAPQHLDELQGDLLELFARDKEELSLNKARRKFIWRALFSLRWYRLPRFEHFHAVTLYKSFYKVAIRHALKHRSASSIQVLGLMLGLAATFYIGLFVHSELQYDHMHERGDHMYRVLRQDTQTGARVEATSSLYGEALEKEFPFLSMCRMGNDLVKLGEINPILEKEFYWADSTFFDLFNFQFIHGDSRTCLDEINSIVLTQSLCQQLFGTVDVLGKTMQVKVYDSDDVFPMNITGIIKDPPTQTHIQFRALGSMPNAKELYGNLLNTWGFSWVRTYIYTPENRIQEVRDGIPQLILKYLGDQAPKNFGIDFQAFYDVYHDSQDIDGNTFKGNKRNLAIFSIIGMLILLISLLNYINLATARSITRAKEVGIRKVLGAQKRAVTAQFIVESTLFTLGGGIAGILLTIICLPALNRLFQIDLKLASLSLLNWSFIFVLLLFLGFLVGILPAVMMNKIPRISQTKTAISFKTAQWPFTRKLFIGIQYFVTIGLLISTLVIFQQYNYLKNYNLGFDSQQLLHIPVDDRNMQSHLMSIKTEMEKINGVYGITATGENLPSELNNTWDLNWDGSGLENPLNIDIVGVDKDYFKLLDIDFVEGKNFLLGYDRDSASSVILNEKAQDIIEKSPLLNQQVHIGGKNRNVIGIVKNYHNKSLHTEIRPLAYMIFPPGFRVSADNLFLKVDTKDIPNLLTQLKATWQDFSTEPFKYNFVDDAFAQAYSLERRFSFLIGAFTIIAISIAVVGLFGMVSFIVQLKLKEISIRRILGANAVHLLRLLSRDMVGVFIIAAICALPLSYLFLKQWLANFAYSVSIQGWVVLPGILICLILSLSIIFFHLQRATRLNPSEVISRE